jgi:hypothetical protein
MSISWIPKIVSVAAPGFSPSSITGLAVWLDASDATTITQATNSNISQWRDKSGNGQNAVSNSVIGWAVPTYVSTGATKYVSMTDGQALYLPSFGLSTGWSVFSCMCNFTLGARWYISPYSDLGLVLMGMGHGNNKIFSGLLGGGNDVAGSHIEFTSAQNMNGTGAYTYYRDGTIIDSNNTGNSIAAATVRMGIGANGAAGFDVAGTYYPFEIMIFNQYLGTTDRKNVEGYLAQKWGLTSSLSTITNHPVFSSNYLTSSGLGNSPASQITWTTLPKAFGLSIPSPLTLLPQLWIDASDATKVTTSGGNLTGITDKSGCNVSLTINGTISYNSGNLNGLATLGFTGAQSITGSLASAVGTGDYGLALVWRTTSSGTIGALGIGPSAAYNKAAIGYNGTYYNLYEWGSQESHYNTSAGSYVVQVGTRISGSTNCYINGSNPNSTGTTNCNITNTLVNVGGSDTFYVTGQICEAIVIKGTVGTSSRQGLEAYLANKWGLTGQMASGNSYMANGLSTNSFFLSRIPYYVAPVVVGTNLITNMDAASYTSGSTWTALTGNNYTVTGSPSTVATPGGPNAIVFAGSQYAQDQTGVSTSTTFSYTIDVWFYAADGASGCIVGEQGGVGVPNGWNDAFVAIDGTNVVNVGFWNGSTTYKVSCGSYSANTWTHVSYSYSISTNAIIGYVNGVQVATATNTKLWSGTNRICISLGGQANPNNNFTGRIGAFKWYNVVLSATDVKQNYNALASRFGLSQI